MKRLAIAFAALLLAGGAASARPGVAATTVNLRAEPNTASAVLAKIPTGGRIEVGDCKDDWCGVIYKGQSGYAIATALDTTNRPRRATAPVRRPVPGVVPYDPYDDEVIVSGPPVVYAPGPYYYGGYYGPRFYGGYYGPRFYGRGYGYRGWGRRR
jgi:uncharacterized protein YraI